LPEALQDRANRFAVLQGPFVVFVWFVVESSGLAPARRRQLASLRAMATLPNFQPMSDAKAGLDGVIAAAKQAPGRGLPPVHLWDPPHRGDIDIVIKKDGSWIHEGGRIGREALVRLFSTVLRKDEDGIYLVTPVEKMRITVEDAPFVAVRVDRAKTAVGGERLIFLTNVGDEVEAGPDNAIRVETGEDGEPRPYLHVRCGLEALISRPVFYELVEMAQERETPAGRRLGVASGGAWFDLGPAA
jgi:hypothetical protein